MINNEHTRKHEEFNKNCINCMKELVNDQGKLVNALYDRLDHLYDVLPAISNKPEEMRAFLLKVEERFPVSAKGPTYILLEDELKKASAYGGQS